MASNDILVLIAELAVGIAGFSSVVVALDVRSVSEWSPSQQRNLRILLQVSAHAILFSLFPLILQRAVETPAIWNPALAVQGAVHAVAVSWFLRHPVAGESQIPPTIGLIIAVASLGVAALASPTFAEVTYLCALVWDLGIAGMSFALLVFRSPGQGAP